MGAVDVGEVSEMDDLKKKVLAILNKLTPQKFQTLVDKFQELPIDTQDKLSVCMELVFEKAVDEPAFSVAYAQMCKVMQMKKVPIDGAKEDTEFVNFRKLLISRCQKEFEKDYLENLDREKYVQDMAAASSEQEKKKIKAVFEQEEMKLRRRSLGNIRFIGELYKLHMLTARIMHECVKKLLMTTDEESLECLCRLVTTVGQDLEVETSGRLAKGPQQGINDLSVYFKEIEKEQLAQKLAHMAPMGPPPNRRDDRGNRNDRNDRNDDRRRSQKGGPGGGGGGGHGGEDGWQAVPTRVASRSQYEKIDTNKLRNIQQSAKQDADTMSFGPPKGGGGGAGGFGTWGRGSQSAKTSRQEPSTMQNRFAQLEQSDSGPPQSYDGRSSGGRFGRQNSQQDRGYGGRNSR